ncbi:MAG: hypothetical protein BGN85_03750 [Alphaproteobacteria bacterium 64-11]|nr:MAG: hypothetical protein BGN85_03750 [Alphaproteobacteria bacterium 64-11]
MDALTMGGDERAAAVKDTQLRKRTLVEPVRVDFPGHLFVPSEERETSCRTIELSSDGASIQCEGPPPCGTSVVLYVSGVGRFEGAIARIKDDVVEVQFICTAAKRERTAEQIAALRNNDKGSDGGSILRRHERSSRKSCAQFTCVNGQIVSCEIVDISLSGVSLRTDVRPPIGEFVLIAQVAGRVSRHFEKGIGIEFVGRESRAPYL